MANEPAAPGHDLFQPDLFHPSTLPDFDGPDYEPEFDRERLTGQLRRVYLILFAAGAWGIWLTLGELQDETRTNERPKGDPEASISAQLRHLRKPRFGSHVIEKRRRGHAEDGLWEYRMGSDG